MTTSSIPYYSHKKDKIKNFEFLFLACWLWWINWVTNHLYVGFFLIREFFTQKSEKLEIKKCRQLHKKPQQIQIETAVEIENSRFKSGNGGLLICYWYCSAQSIDLFHRTTDFYTISDEEKDDYFFLQEKNYLKPLKLHLIFMNSILSMNLESNYSYCLCPFVEKKITILITMY